MKNKFIYQIIFVLIVALGSFLLATYVESAKVTDFIVNERSRIEEDDHRLLLATAIANGQDGSDAFILKQPDLMIEIESINLNVHIHFYSLSLFNHDNQTNVWAIYLNHLTIQDELANVDGDDYNLIQVSLTFNQSITLGETLTNTTLETFITLYTNEQKLLFIETDRLLERYPQLLIQHLHFSYPLSNGDSTSFYSLSPQELDDVQWNPESLFSMYENSYADSPDIIYDETLLVSLQSLNHYYLSHFTVYIIIIGVLTYVFFFRKRKQNTR
jgi:hypothetical protein